MQFPRIAKENSWDGRNDLFIGGGGGGANLYVNGGGGQIMI